MNEDCNLQDSYLRNGLDIGPELLLDAVQGEPVVVGDEVDGDTEVPEATGTTNAMQVRLRHAREIEVDHNVDGLNVDASREQV